MQPVKPPNATRTLTAPPGHEDEIIDLPIIDVVIGDEKQHVHAMVSCWQPTVEELALMAAGTPVLLWIYGVQMPPAALTVGDPRLFSEHTKGKH